MEDKYDTMKPGLSDPAVRWAVVTPDDNADLANLPRALYIAGAGDLVAVSVFGDEVTFQSLPDYGWLAIRAKRVKATGTTATGIVALW